MMPACIKSITSTPFIVGFGTPNQYLKVIYLFDWIPILSGSPDIQDTLDRLIAFLCMNLEKANLAIKVAIERANVIGSKFCIAIMDAGVNLVAFSRMDGGRVGTIDVAMKKVSRET